MGQLSPSSQKVAKGAVAVALVLCVSLTSCSSTSNDTASDPAPSVQSSPANVPPVDSAAQQPPVVSNETVPVITMPPVQEFSMSFTGAFTPDDVQSIRLAQPDYQTTPIMTLDEPQDGSEIVVQGRVSQDGERFLTAIYYEAGASQPTWSLRADPAFAIDCTGGVVTTLRSDPAGCDSGIVQQWTEDDSLWTLEGQSLTSATNPIERLSPSV